MLNPKNLKKNNDTKHEVDFFIIFLPLGVSGAGLNFPLCFEHAFIFALFDSGDKPKAS